MIEMCAMVVESFFAMTLVYSIKGFIVQWLILLFHPFLHSFVRVLVFVPMQAMIMDTIIKFVD